MFDTDVRDKEDNLNKSRLQEKASVRSFLKIIMILICVSTFLYSAYRLYVIGHEYSTATNEYKKLQKYVEKIPSDKSKSNFSSEININFKELKAINNDVIGWIYFENIDINYPIVKGTDNTFYLNHTFKKEVNKSGSIFMDYTNDEQFKDFYTILYGHNLKNSSMFSALMKYKEKDFYVSNHCFWIYTPSGKLKCEIFSCYITSSTSKSYNKNFESKEQYGSFLRDITNNSIYDTGVTVTAEDSIVSLSTCTNSDKESRIIVHAKVIKQ
ncbi:class B sortase [Clostridium sp. YIM B02505]|uniref:Class B sortase n=1 Tax=Clostridium yunnanense TaxID=2800325 RepID=A0ABS1EKA0_9CLOT|nr:class B sortase [Clostridium yunnanense]MBK1809791.1 class B sortase [Clostridium yunnanense]